MRKRSNTRYILAILIASIISFYAGKKISDKVAIEHMESLTLEFDPLLNLLEKSIEANYEPKNLRESIIVRLANKADITMYGRQINDNLTPNDAKGRRKYELHPYGKAGAGANVLVTYKDKNSNEQYILLGRKYNNVNDKSKGLSNQLILPGGYMHPYPLEGGRQVTENLNSEDMDKAEEDILLGKDGYNQLQASKNATTTPTNQDYDIDLEHNAIRELNEETGIIWNEALQGLPKPLSTRSTYGYTNDKRLHTIVGDYLFDCGSLDNPPLTKAGSDIAEVMWIKSTDIISDDKVGRQEYGSILSRYKARMPNGELLNIRDDHGEVISLYLQTRTAD